MLKVTKHSGKLKGIYSLNTNSLTNRFCQSMKNNDTVCSKCYSDQLLAYRKSARTCFQKNSELLSTWNYASIDIPDIPIIMSKTNGDKMLFRFNSFGELINCNHFQNLVYITNQYPDITFALWTKRKDLVDINIIPDNMVLIYSSSKLNVVDELPEGFHKVFTVFTKDYIKEHNIKINCEQKCFECRKCYDIDNGITNIFEQLK